VQKPYGEPDYKIIPQKGTNRPFLRGDTPRKQSERQRMRVERLADYWHGRHIKWLEWVQQQIAETTAFDDHWKDPRWDELPPEWEYKAWEARQKLARKTRT